MSKYKVKLKIVNPQRMKEFTKLNNYVNFVAENCRPLYNEYCKNQTQIKDKIRRENPDFVIEGLIEEIK